MRSTGLLALATVAAAMALPGATAECSYCRYSAWNCSVEESILNESNVQGAKAELRKEAPPPLSVCNAEGKIQIDDVFCTDSDCACADGKRCASMMLGCQNIFQARNRKRCIGDAAIQQRFQNCARNQALTTQTKANLNPDWVHFNNLKLCQSEDCDAVRQFQKCRAVECGRLVVAWKESATEYRFVVDGSRADMQAGTFLFSATVGSSNMCSSITSKTITDCYSLQTRNQKDSNCEGIYLQADTNLLAAGPSPRLSELQWPEYLVVVGSVVAAVASVASVIFVVVRHRREREQEERDGLLPDNSTELKTPELDPDASQPTAPSLRQRPMSPQAQGSQ